MEQIFLFSFNMIQDESGASNLPVWVKNSFMILVAYMYASDVANALKSVLIKLIKTA